MQFEKTTKRGANGVTAIRLLLSHEAHEWIAKRRAEDRRPRALRPTMSHIAEKLCWLGIEAVDKGEVPFFDERKTRGKFAELSQVGRVQELYCPAELKAALETMQARVNRGEFPASARSAKGICVANVAHTLIETAIKA